MKKFTKTYYTDYPFTELGDISGKEAPVREIQIVSYDDDKYVSIVVEGLHTEIKSGYVYTQKGSYGEVPVISRKELASFVKPRTTCDT